MKAEIEKNNNVLTSTVIGLKLGIEQGITALNEDQKKTQEYLNNFLARLSLHTSFLPPSHNPGVDPFNTPHPSTHKTPGQHDTKLPHKVHLFNIPSISIPPTDRYHIRVKLELPKFDDDKKQCIPWINKTEEYFDIHNILYDNEKIKYTAMQLDENAYN